MTRVPTPQQWDAVADRYDSLYSDPWSQHEDFGLASLMRRLLPTGLILDVGSGTGLSFSLIGAGVVGVDSSQRMLENAQQKHPDGLLVRASALALPFGTSKFDAAICLNGVASYTNDLATTAREMTRVTKPGGIVILSYLNRRSLRRLLRLKVRQTERYFSRGCEPNEINDSVATYKSKEVEDVLRRSGNTAVTTYGTSVLAGTLQLQLLQKFDRRISPVAGGLSHHLYTIGHVTLGS